MKIALASFTIHVPNVWQTVEWYRQVFVLTATLLPDATVACFNVTDTSLIFGSHDAQTDTFGPRRLNSFLADPPAFHLDVATADVQALFDRALAHGGVGVTETTPDASGQPVAALRDLNGILIRLTQLESIVRPETKLL